MRFCLPGGGRSQLELWDWTRRSAAWATEDLATDEGHETSGKQENHDVWMNGRVGWKMFVGQKVIWAKRSQNQQEGGRKGQA